MTEKYKIYLPEEMRARLYADAELFEFTKKDGSVNLNAFLKELLIHYFEQYRQRKVQLLQDILSDINSFPSISDKDAEALAERIIHTYMREEKTSADKNAVITLTASGSSLDVIRVIENTLLRQSSLSQYLKDMFQSYLSIARSNREKILFQDTLKDLDAAISKNQVITFSSAAAPDQFFTVAPYMIAASKEEQCNYLLCCDSRNGVPRSFRISRIKAIFPTSEAFVPDEAKKLQLQEAALHIPQDVSRFVDACVQLTPRGIRKFQLIVKNRPDVLKKEGNLYYFHWPKRQLEDYFKRFGADALFLKPASCRETLRVYYEKALKAYERAGK